MSQEPAKFVPSATKAKYVLTVSKYIYGRYVHVDPGSPVTIELPDNTPDDKSCFKLQEHKSASDFAVNLKPAHAVKGVADSLPTSQPKDVERTPEPKAKRMSDRSL